MKLTKPYHILLLGLYLTIAECKTPFGIKVYNIKKFMRSPHRIWTYATTAGRHCWCQADVTQFIDEAKIVYTHYFLSPGELKRHTKMKGYFPKKNLMFVQPYGSSNEVKHEIVYFDKSAKCAVIKVSSAISSGGNMNKLDLRVWNTHNVAHSAQPCIPVFRRISRELHVVYKDMCQKLLDKGRPSQDQDVEGRKNPRDFVCLNYG
uniref:Lipocalin n=1 Tax=Rhipicephalus zambeziensis TaxID=60191 RepID=A0A224YL92_9ACAR